MAAVGHLRVVSRLITTADIFEPAGYADVHPRCATTPAALHRQVMPGHRNYTARDYSPSERGRPCCTFALLSDRAFKLVSVRTDRWRGVKPLLRSHLHACASHILNERPSPALEGPSNESVIRLRKPFA